MSISTPNIDDFESNLKNSTTTACEIKYQTIFDESKDTASDSRLHISQTEVIIDEASSKRIEEMNVDNLQQQSSSPLTDFRPANSTPATTKRAIGDMSGAELHIDGDIDGDTPSSTARPRLNIHKAVKVESSHNARNSGRDRCKLSFVFFKIFFASDIDMCLTWFSLFNNICMY